MKKALFLCMMLAFCLTTAVFAQSPCDPPTNVNVVSGTTSATVSWTGNSELYNVLYLRPTFYFGADDDEGFEGWLSHDADGDGYGWEISYGTGRDGSDAFVSYSYVNGVGAINPDNWLITPVIDLGGTLSVWMMSHLFSYPDKFAIYLTTNPDWSSLDDFTITLVDTTTAPSEWKEYTADLSAYAGMQGRIAIRHFNSYDQFRLYMDDFSVNGQTLLSNVSSPVEITGLYLTSPIHVQVQAVCSDDVSEWTDPVTTTHGLCDDPYNVNLTQTTSNTATIAWTGFQEQYTVKYIRGTFYEGFENGGLAAEDYSLPSGWTTIDADGDGYNWYELSPWDESHCHSGAGLATSASYANYTALTPDNWLITPLIDLNGTMRVWLKGQDPTYASEHFAIYLSTTGTTVDDFTTTLVSEQVATGEYVEYTADLSAHAGQQGYIAIRHFSTYDMFRLNVDDISVFMDDDWTTVTASGNSINLTGLDPETPYIVQVQGICEDGVTAWSDPVEFTTAAATTPPCEISVINIEGFTVPEWGANPDYDDVYVEDTRCTLTDLYWKKNGASVLSESDIFNENAFYYMRFSVSTNEGCSFAEDVTITINGDASIVDQGYTSLSSHYCVFFSIDFYVTKPATEPCAVPTGLEVLDITGNSATVNWDPSDAENYDLRYYVALDELENESWKYYDNGTKNDAIGGVGTFWWGVMFPGGNYSSSTTAAVLHVKAFDYEATTGTVTLYNDGDNAPANPVGSTNFTFTGSNQFVEFTFDEPVAIDPSKNLWVVFNNESGAYYPAAVCANTGDPNGRWVSLDGSTWEDLSNYSLDNTFMIRAGIFDVDVNELSWTEIHGLSDNTASLTGLAANTDYKVQVRANCEYSGSAWSDPVEFTTAEETEPIEPVSCDPTSDCEGTSYPTVKIGDLCWMQKNLAAVSCVTSGNVYAYVSDQFPDEDANTAAYGLLYDEEAVMQGIGSGAKAASDPDGICPDGYRLPTVAEIEALGAAYTADELKSTNYWVSGGAGTDASGFGWLPGGCYNYNTGRFERMTTEGYLWATETVNGEVQPAMYKMTYYCSTILIRVEDYQGLSASVRCVKEAEPQPEPEPEPEPEPQPEPEPEPETFTCGTDNLIIGENSYPTVQIGTQCWTKTNMREPAGTNGTDLTSDYYYSDTEPFYYVKPNVDAAVYGYYYNWPAANQVCPEGWHLPDTTEWNTMQVYVSTAKDAEGNYMYRCGGDSTYIAQALATDGDYWYRGGVSESYPCEPEYDLTKNNKTGFSAVPACYWYFGFGNAGYDAYFWSSTELGTDDAWLRGLSYYRELVLRLNGRRYFGFSVRCVRD